MRFDAEKERRANQIIRQADLYNQNLAFRYMVDNTVFLTVEQKQESSLEVDRVYGATSPLAGSEYGT